MTKPCKCCQGKYQCPYCKFSFDTKADLKMHSYNHTDVRKGKKDQTKRRRNTHV